MACGICAALQRRHIKIDITVSVVSTSNSQYYTITLNCFKNSTPATLTLKVFPCCGDIWHYVGHVAQDGSEDHYSSWSKFRKITKLDLENLLRCFSYNGSYLISSRWSVSIPSVCLSIFKVNGNFLNMNILDFEFGINVQIKPLFCNNSNKSTLPFFLSKRRLQ